MVKFGLDAPWILIVQGTNQHCFAAMRALFVLCRVMPLSCRTFLRAQRLFPDGGLVGRWRIETAVRDVAEKLSWDVAASLTDLIPTYRLAITICHAFLHESGLVRHDPATAGSCIQQIIGEVERELDTPAKSPNGPSLRRSHPRPACPRVLPPTCPDTTSQRHFLNRVAGAVDCTVAYIWTAFSYMGLRPEAIPYKRGLRVPSWRVACPRRGVGASSSAPACSAGEQRTRPRRRRRRCPPTWPIAAASR